VGVPSDDARHTVGDLDADRIHPLEFGDDVLPFPVPGMSDVMPYASTRFSSMTDAQVEGYLDAWLGHLQRVVRETVPELIHSHHVWLVSSLLKDAAPDTPVVTQCHATGFRQMELCPRLSERVRSGCARSDRFLVLHDGHAVRLAETLGIGRHRIRVVGAGFREELFHARGRSLQTRPRLLYVGKYSSAKGLPWLLDAFESLLADGRDLELHVAGSGSGREADDLRERMSSLHPAVVLHGQLPQQELAPLMRRCAVCVLPSFYEGLPLVLVEAAACGCRLVATELPGVTEQLAPVLGRTLELVPLPPMVGVDTADPGGLPAFTRQLREAIERALASTRSGEPTAPPSDAVESFTWRAVFQRVEAVWWDLLEGRRRI
jgi:glycosyltransferase involved in cell wall biosynthesis